MLSAQRLLAGADSEDIDCLRLVDKRSLVRKLVIGQ